MTFEEARDAFFASDGPYLGPVKMDAWKKGWYARDAELAEKDRRIAVLDKIINQQNDERKRLIDEAMKNTTALEARIEAGMALAEKWKQSSKSMWSPPGAAKLMVECSTELRAALGEPVRKP